MILSNGKVEDVAVGSGECINIDGYLYSLGQISIKAVKDYD